MNEAKVRDHEYSMARSELSTIVNAAKRLQKKMAKGEGEVEAWVQSKITKAADYLDSAADYVDSGEMNKEETVLESIKKSAPLPEPNMGRLSRQSKSFPIQARVSLQPDERNQYFALTLSAADRSGLLYAVAKALAKYLIS